MKLCDPCREAAEWRARSRMPGEVAESCIRMARRSHELCDDPHQCPCRHITDQEDKGMAKAEAHQASDIHRATVRQVKLHSPRTIRLELTEGEADFLLGVLAQTGGHLTNSPWKYARRMADALEGAMGYDASETDAYKMSVGHIEFTEYGSATRFGLANRLRGQLSPLGEVPGRDEQIADLHYTLEVIAARPGLFTTPDVRKTDAYKMVRRAIFMDEFLSALSGKASGQ